MSDKSILEIDLNRLDREWVDQPRLYYEAAMDLAEARSIMDGAKANLDLVEAEVGKNVRSHPSKYGIDKLTENVVTQEVTASKEYQYALKEYNRTRYEVAISQAKVDALDHRKKALEGAVQLHMANYFAEPRARDAKEQIDKMKDERAFGPKKRKPNHA